MIGRRNMIEDINVLQELAVKNKEIYLNKLDIDLENNNEVLMITLDNIHDLFNQELTNKIPEILSSTFQLENISKAITKFNLLLKEELIKLINKKQESLKEEVNNIDNIDYRKIVDKKTSLIIDKIKKVYQKNVIELINDIINEYTINEKDRIEDYLININFEKYIKKIEETIKNMDNILYNNYQESLNKYHDLNEKTLKL